MSADTHIDDVLADQVLRYSQVWEDHRLLEEAFQIIPDDRILSICSAGGNVLALLLEEPKSITAVDLNPAQTALLQLKVAAIDKLFYDEFIVLMGARRGPNRWGLYQLIRPELPEFAQAYWDANRQQIEAGIIGSGKLERYFDTVRQQTVGRFVRPEALADYLACSDAQLLQFLFDRAFGADDFAAAFREQTTQETIARSGRDPTQFKYVEIEDTGDFFYKRFQDVGRTTLPTSNFYFEYFLTSYYADLRYGPPYLRPQNFLKLRSLLPRLEIITGGIDVGLQSYPIGHFSKANLSDIFEYLSEEETHRLMELLAKHIRPGGHLAYWNHLVSRQRPESLKAALNPKRDLAEKLYTSDRFFSYRAFHVDQVEPA